MATHSGVLVWTIPWTEEPGRLQPVGSQRLTHDRSEHACKHTHQYANTAITLSLRQKTIIAFIIDKTTGILLISIGRAVMRIVIMFITLSKQP